jgi:hypothetical protein
MVHHEKLVHVEDDEVIAQRYREDLLSKIKKVPGPLGTECWLIPDPNTKYWTAADTAYIAFVGWPKELQELQYVYQKCKRRNCVNPNHLINPKR